MKMLWQGAPCAVAAMLVLGSPPAGAQDATGAVAENQEQADQAGTGLADIVVTAQRRSERTQDIPISISAFGSAELEAQNVTGVETIARRTPGFYLGGAGALRPALFIRGVGSRQADAGSENPVGVFLDDIYLGRASATLGTLKDIERIEVLRGPQGTLYGRNTIGGAVNVLSKAPTPDFEGRAELGASTYDGWSALVAAGGPVTEGGDVRTRFAAWRDKRRGYFENLTTGNHGIGVDNLGARARIDADLSDGVVFSGIADYSHDGDGAAFNGKHVGNVLNRNNVFLARAGLVAAVSPDRYAEHYTTDSRLRRRMYGFTGKLVADLKGAELTSISGYRVVDADDSRDVDASSLDAIEQFSSERSKQFTQEFRLGSQPGGLLTFGDHLSWLVGAYYYHDRSFRSDLFRLGRDSVVGLLPTLPVTRASADYTSESYAFFGQAVIKPVEGVEITLGGRYSHDTKSGNMRGTNTIPGTPLIAVPYATGKLERSWSSFDPKAVLAYHFNPDVNLYASYSKGFKSGGFQFVPLSDAQARLIYDPERMEAWEIGLKSRLFQSKVQINISAFKYNYDDMQVVRNVPVGNNSVAVLVTNAGTSKIKGADVEFRWKPASALELGATYNYLDAKFTNYIFAPNGVVVTPSANFSGTRLTRAPKHSLSTYAELTIADVGSGEIMLRGDYSYRTKFFFEPGEGNVLYGTTAPLTVQKGYGLLDLRATYRAGPVSFSLYAENVMDRYYVRNATGLGSTITHYPGAPRVFGALLGYRF